VTEGKSSAREAQTLSIPARDKGATMAGIGKHKLSDSIPQPRPEPGIDGGGKPVPTPETAAEQIREADERAKAKAAEASNRDRMVDIGRGNQQAGRQGS